ncbi:MAG TPA: serpin family protein [Bryobacteraceae bacterium]|jgi:serpin B
MADTRALIEQSKPAAESQNRFGHSLLNLEAAAHPHENVFISPVSLYLALAMTESGADGKTRTAMRKTLEIPESISEDAMHQSGAALLEALRSQRGGELAIANALWSNPNMPLAPAFIQKAKTVYDAEARTLDFSKPAEAADIVNAWVKDKTKGKIPSIVTPEVMRAAQAVLTNAVYFAGKWRREFWEGDTTDADFHLNGNGVKKVRMMLHRTLRGAYKSGDGYQAAALPYQGSSVAMYVILPADGVTPEQALLKAAPGSLIEQNQPFDLELRLPRFSIGYSTSLKDTLTKMGMGIAFEYPGAEFAPMGSPLFFISQVVHKTRLEVDEKGTVAAAATAVIMGAGAGAPKPQEKKVLVFDRPFALMICDSSTGAVLFEGVVFEP